MDLFFNAKVSLTSKIATGLFESFIFYFGIIHQDDLQTNDLSFHIPHAIFAHGMLGTTTTQPPFSKPSSDPTLSFSLFFSLQWQLSFLWATTTCLRST